MTDSVGSWDEYPARDREFATAVTLERYQRLQEREIPYWTNRETQGWREEDNRE